MASSAAATSNGISLKILVDTENQKVVFAEAGKDFVDFLFNISYLPVGTMAKLLADHDAMGGCLTNIYQVIESSSQDIMRQSLNKYDIMNPKCVTFSASNDQSVLNFQTPTSSTFHVRRNTTSWAQTATNVSCYSCPTCKSCCNSYSVEPAKVCTVDNKGYVKGEWTYIVMDDLTVRLVSAISGIDIINGVRMRNSGILKAREVVSAISGVDLMKGFFGIKNVGILEAREVQLGDDNPLKLLKASILSMTVLTDVFFVARTRKTQNDAASTANIIFSRFIWS